VTTATRSFQPDYRLLHGRPRGRIVRPSQPGYDDAREAFNLTLDQRPAMVALPAYADEVAGVVRYARERGLRVAPQRTGHNASPLGSLEDTVLLKTDAMQGIKIDLDARRARVRAGAKWENIVPQLSELGVAALHGSSPDIGIVGYSLGGGMGWYARKHGLQTNSVTAIEIVTSDGRRRRVDHEHEPELFWALRGGSGNFGVVTALEFELYDISEVYAGVLFFPWERASEVLHAWREWLPGVPEELTSVGRIMQFPQLPEVPEPLRGGSFAMVEAFYLGSETDGEDLLRPLRELGPAMDTFAMLPPVGLADIHMDPPDPTHYAGDHQLLADFPARAVDDLVAAAGPGSGSTLVSAEVRHTGGALGRSGPHHGAMASMAGSFATFSIGMAMDDAGAEGTRADLARVADALAPYDAGRRYSNFTEDQSGPERFFPAETVRRLQAVKSQYDPENVFRANHPITRKDQS